MFILEKIFTYTWNNSILFFRRRYWNYIIHLSKYNNYLFLNSNYFKKNTHTHFTSSNYFNKLSSSLIGGQINFLNNNQTLGMLKQNFNKIPKSAFYTNLIIITLTTFTYSVYYFWYIVLVIIITTTFKIKTNLSNTILKTQNQLDGNFWKQTFYRNLLENKFNVFSYAYNSSQIKHMFLKNLYWKSSTLDIKHYSIKKQTFLFYNNIYNNNLFIMSDYVLLYMLTKSYSTLVKLFLNTKATFFIKQVNWFFYGDAAKKKLVKFSIRNYTNYYLSGLKSFWRAIRYWLVGIFLFFFIFFYFLQIKDVPFNKSIFGYFIVSMYFYWLMSGFVFFVKKYQYSKFTSVIQRFWKRTFILFWMIEGSLVLVFIFLTLNASTEPMYMYDQIQVYKTHLFSWRWFLVKIIPSILLIISGYYLQMTVRWGVFCRQSVLILSITLLVVYILWVEFYQFFHVVSYYGNFFWTYDSDEFLWSIELDDRRNRICNNYVTICLCTKFWHIVFMFVFWLFFVLRVNELKRLRYPLIVANVQNFFILYLLAWVYMYPWFKFLFRKLLDNPYYWFNLSFRRTGLRIFILDIKLNLLNLYNLLLYKTPLSSYNYTSFYYWYNTSSALNLGNYRKSSIKDLIITTLSNHTNYII